MKLKNTSSRAKIVSRTRLEPGETITLEEVSVEDLPRHVEVVEKSGGTGSDQNTKTENQESEQENDSDNGGE